MEELKKLLGKVQYIGNIAESIGIFILNKEVYGCLDRLSKKYILKTIKKDDGVPLLLNMATQKLSIKAALHLPFERTVAFMSSQVITTR